MAPSDRAESYINRLLEDRKFQQETQRAVASLKDGGARLRGEPRNSYRGRRIVGVLLALGGAALAVREVLRDPGPDAPWG